MICITFSIIRSGSICTYWCVQPGLYCVVRVPSSRYNGFSGANHSIIFDWVIERIGALNERKESLDHPWQHHPDPVPVYHGHCGGGRVQFLGKGSIPKRSSAEGTRLIRR